ncbi:beta-galactosidase [Mangrovihabitans endophyticus]|uniref:Beta-galactosidase n=1 Tax=Mangrovihabitans endophyticus TaxID=1751298 RepID=A0A8J3C324_9ACTN|nr:beta-galactosidase [Mangrovihabitans endophyticus]GGL02140.1 beta-galactosidase [Mangrovihabitans endophyticus]
MFYGGDYNPEQWPERVQDEDMALMRAAGITAVTVGVFSWSWLEPAPGRYEFDWLDRVLDRLAAHRIAAVLATPTASPPPWFSLAHPEALPVGADGVRLSHGSRDTYCASAPAYRAAARSIAAVLAHRYAEHPALALWHVHNEYGTTCHCDITAEAFRGWLRARHGDLDGLNEAWTTAFWSQRYTDWAQVRPPRVTQYLPNPAQVLDFRRFTSDELLDAYVEQRDVLRAATPGIPVTTNFVLGDWVPVDHARWSREVDLVAVDHYPNDAGPAAEEQAAFAADLARGWARSAGAADWLLMETAPNLIYTPDRMHTKEPGRMVRQSIAAVARESRGAMFFQWRAPCGGAELFHSALVPHAGPDNRVFREAVELGDRLPRLTEAAAGRVDARVAVLFDEPSAWALQAPGLPAQVNHRAEAERAHRALWRLGITADVLGGGDLSRYAMVVLPAHYLMSDERAGRLRAWVVAGGRLVVTYLSGVADEHARIRTGGYPGALRNLLGVRVEEFHPVPPGETVPLSGGGTGAHWTETVHPEGADVVTRYAAGVLDGRPAVTRHALGHGESWYVSTRVDAGGLATLLRTVAEAAGIGPVCADLPPGVDAVRRRDGERSWLFLLNHTPEAHAVRAAGVDLLTGDRADGIVELAAGGVAVIREDPASGRVVGASHAEKPGKPSGR